MGGEEGIGAIDQHAPKLEGLRGKTEHPIVVLHHLLPHIVERVRQQRQGTHVLDRILSRPARNDVRKLRGLKPCRKQFGRPAHHLAQFRLAQRRHIDLPTHFVKWFVFLQLTEKIGTHAHQRVQARVGYTLRNHLREPPALALLGAYVKLLPLIDVEQERWRLGLMQRVAVTRLSRIEQVP